MNLFFENSTRTKSSFEIAAKRLGAELLNFDVGKSSVSKGETLFDTMRTVDALGVDISIIRHSDDSYLESLKGKHSFSVVNAGAGKYEHPSQSLLDLLTIQEEFGKIDGLKIAILGDIYNSRVAKSNIRALSKFDCEVLLAGPEQLMPDEEDIRASTKVVPIEDAIKEADVIMLLRIQHERHSLYEINTDTYNKNFGLNPKRVELMKEASIFMHPGPFNREVEITSDLIDHPKSRIFKQVENGVYTRMSILEWINL